MKMLNVVSGFNLFGLEIKFYGILIALGMLIGIIVAVYNTKFRDLKPEDIYTVALYALPLAIVGARLYYVLFSGETFSFWEVFAIWKGGMAIYGGVIGGALGVLLFCLIHKKIFLKLADVACISLVLGQSIGRIGCYFSGCCYGIEVTNPNLMWFPFSTMINGTWHLSTFFYESFFDMVIFIGLLFAIKKIKTDGVIMSLYFIFYGIVRCIIEGFRGDSLFLGNSGIRVSQLLSGILIIVGIFLLLFFTLKPKWKKSKEQLPLE